MRLSKYLMPTFSAAQAAGNGSDVQNLLEQAGLVHQNASGIFDWLPTGKAVRTKVEGIIRARMNEIEAQEMEMSILQSAELWQESGRRNDYGKELMVIDLARDANKKKEFILGPTNEEAITAIVREHVSSYRQLPLSVYQITRKFRNEMRPRFGLVRSIEFIMKDAYTFDLTAEGSRLSYERMFAAYGRIFNDLGLKVMPVQASTGEIGGDLSHEFIVRSVAGESEYRINPAAPKGLEAPGRITADADIHAYFNENARRFGMDVELAPDAGSETGFNASIRALELGHIFNLGTKYSESMNAAVMDATGTRQTLHMGCYGIGVSRVVAALAEANRDERGIAWPRNVAPFDVSIVNVFAENHDAQAYAENLYANMRMGGISVSYDDRDNVTAGRKLRDADLIGAPHKVIIGKRSFNEGNVEIENRRTGQKTLVARDNLPIALLSLS